MAPHAHIAVYKALYKRFGGFAADVVAAIDQAIEKDGTVVQALTSRRQLILDNIRDNDEAGAGYRKDIELNERRHRQLQNMIEEAISNSENNTYLHILSQYRLLGMANTELQFEIAMRDQFIHNQRDAQQKMWNVLDAQQKMWNVLLGLGLDQKQIYGLAAKQSIVIEDWNTPHVYFPGKTHLPYPNLSGQHHASTPSDFQHYEDISSVGSLRSTCHSQTLHRQEHHSSYYSLSNDHSHSSSLGTRRHSASGQADTYSYTAEKLAQVPCSYCPPSRYQPCLCSQNCFIPSPCSEGSQQPKESWLANRRGLQESPRVGAVEGLVHVESARYGVRSSQPLHGNPAASSIATSRPQYNHCYDTRLPPSCPDFSKFPVRCAIHSEGL